MPTIVMATIRANLIGITLTNPCPATMNFIMDSCCNLSQRQRP